MDEPVLTEARRSPEERLLHLRWDDGATAALDYDLLRGWCPCAACQGHSGRITYHPPPRPVTVADIEPVGNYAISIAFSDRHATGIFGFSYLRQLADHGEIRHR